MVRLWGRKHARKLGAWKIDDLDTPPSKKKTLAHIRGFDPGVCVHPSAEDLKYTTKQFHPECNKKNEDELKKNIYIYAYDKSELCRHIIMIIDRHTPVDEPQEGVTVVSIAPKVDVASRPLRLQSKRKKKNALKRSHRIK